VYTQHCSARDRNLKDGGKQKSCISAQRRDGLSLANWALPDTARKKPPKE
jgi:hypothetical protein